MNFTDLTLLTYFFELIALFLAVLNYYKYKTTAEKWFLFFLLYTVVTETIGHYNSYVREVYDLTVYQVFLVVSFLFYFYWYFSILKSKLQRRVTLALGLVFLCYAIYNLIVLPWDNHHYKTFVLGAVINIIVSIFFFSQLLNDKKEIEVAHNLKFWIATGLLLFNVGMVPFMLFSEEFSAKSETRTVILVVLNFILYGCYSLGFILCKKPTGN